VHLSQKKGSFFVEALYVIIITSNVDRSSMQGLLFRTKRKLHLTLQYSLSYITVITSLDHDYLDAISVRRLTFYNHWRHLFLLFIL